MDYLELDDSAFQALTEMGGGGTDVFTSDLSPNEITPSSSTRSTHRPRRRGVEAKYLLRLEHPLSTPQDVANSLALPRVPDCKADDDCKSSFCILSESHINVLESWTAQNYPKKKWTKIKLDIAHKDPGELPVLGRDPTMPQHRPSVPACSAVEDQFPVDYFFYGTLAEPERLARLFNVPESDIPALEHGTLLNGRIRTWAGKYKALVDAPGEKVEGHVFRVMSVEQEDALRGYERDSYEVVRARVVVRGREREVRTFRFCGFEDEWE